MSDKITDQNDLIIILDSVLNQKDGLIKHHIDSMNLFTSKGIKQIVSSGFKIEVEINNERDKTEEDRSIKKYIISANITDVELTPPTAKNYDTQKSQIITPNMAHNMDLTYSSEMRVNADIIATAYKHNNTIEIKKANIERYMIGKMPIMVKSQLCNTYNQPKSTLINLNEDPSDIGGYFIVKGNEWCIDNIESMSYNIARIFYNKGHKNEISRGDIISKPGDNFENSSILHFKLLTNNSIIFEITNNKFRDISIPFYMLFRAFGAETDKEIIENITYSLNENDTTIKSMLNILEKAFHAKYVTFTEAANIHETDKIIELIGSKINDYYLNDIKVLNKDTIKYNNYSVRKILNNDILPHIGKTENDRKKKIRFLGHLIQKLLLLNLGMIQSTDRDSYNNKRIYSAGVSYAKMFKQRFNAAIVQFIKRQFRKDFKAVSFSSVDLHHSFTTAIYSQEFERSLIQSIITGDKSITIRRKQQPNRLSSQQLHRKNAINIISTLRNVNTKNTSSAKQSTRANEMRRFHPSMVGYICCVQSADTGEKVGMQKQMAISARITSAGSSELLKILIYEDNELILLDNIKNIEIYKLKLTKVFINGDWVGCCKNPSAFVKKYRTYRRKQKIYYQTTISLDVISNEIYFWVDVGRIIRPLLIVYDNEKGGQEIKLKKHHLKDLQSGKIDLDNLIEQEIIEFIAPEEQINCLIAKDLNKLMKHENDPLLRFTHVDIPQAIIGLPGLTSPFANHNQAARVVFQTNQVKQTCGWPCLNWPDRTYKEMYLQIYNEIPLIKTITNKYIPPTGSNAIVAIMIYGGYNQEDSLIINQGAIDRGLFTTYHFSFEKTDLEKGEEFTKPNPLNTMDIKAYSNYDKLVNGIVPIGTYIENGDVIIGKIAKLQKTEIIDNMKYTDRSIVYKYQEPAYVWNIIKGRNEEDNEFCKVVFKSLRKCDIGDKFCLDDSHEVLTDNGWKFINTLKLSDKIAILNNNNCIKYEYPIKLNKFYHNGELYNCNSSNLDITCTLNHKCYIKINKNDDFKLIHSIDLLNTNYYCKKNCNNDSLDIKSFHSFNMDSWLIFLGIFISNHYNNFNDNYIKLFINKQNIKDQLNYVLSDLQLNYNICNNYYIINNNYIKKYLSYFYLPNYIWNLSQRQSKLLLNSIISNNNYYFTLFKQLADDIQRLCIHSGYGSDILYYNNQYKISIIKHDIKILKHSINIINKNCNVYCPTVSSGIFMVRKNGKQYWTGNSSRSGQKGVVGMIYRDSDMPFTSQGIKPDIIFNPHSLPTRMTMSKIIESMASKISSVKGGISDGTMFKNIDIDDFAAELTSLGFNKNGTERLYNGMTGKYIDTEIFIGPIYYQRLQKFTVDTVYSHKTCPTDVVVKQPLDGKSSQGGLRIGEMETNVLALSSVKNLQEKMIEHSDKYDYYICSNCNTKAIVNIKYNIYKCNYCGDDSDICKIHSTWSTHLLQTEQQCMNIGMKYYPKPNKYEIFLDEL